MMSAHYFPPNHPEFSSLHWNVVTFFTMKFACFSTSIGEFFNSKDEPKETCLRIGEIHLKNVWMMLNLVLKQVNVQSLHSKNQNQQKEVKQPQTLAQLILVESLVITSPLVYDCCFKSLLPF